MAQSIDAQDAAASSESTPTDRAAPPWEYAIPSRALGIALLAFFACLAVAAFASDRPIVWAAAKVVLPALALGLIPGLLLAVVCRAGARWSLTELLGVGIALSLGLSQAPTLIGMGFGLPTSTVALGYAVLLVVGSAALCLRRGTLCQLTLGRSELLVLLAIVAVACVGYVKGSPFFSDEEQIHISVIRRLATVPAPNPHNIHPAEGVTFTHPYPGTHYFMAMLTALGRSDTLFVYHKLRCWWIFATFLFLYVLGRRIFENPAVAAISVFAGIALVLNGAYADFFMIFWGQLAPFSHPSDVALSVLLPGLLLVGLWYYDAVGRRDTLFFFGAAVIVAGMVTMVHIRETVQFLVYSACLLLVTLLFHRSRTRVVRILTLVAVIVVISVGYGLVHSHLVQHIADFDRATKADLVQQLRTGTFATLIGTPFPFHDNTLLFSLFYGWNAVVTLGGPLVCLAFRRQPLVLMMGASILAYLIILRLPVLSILFTYFTHAAMILTPVRNYSFFLYLMTGPLLFLIACQLRRLADPFVGGIVAALVVLALAYATRVDSATWMAHYDWLFLPAIGLYALTGVILLLRPTAASALDWAAQWQGGWRPSAAVILVLVLAALGSGMWERSLLSLHHVTTYSPFLGNDSPIVRSTNHLQISQRSVITPYWELRHTNPVFADYRMTLVNNQSVPPPPVLIQWAKTQLPSDAVLASNALNAYPLPLFLDQRVVAWPPIVSFNLTYPKQVSPAYYELFDRAVLQCGKQPFFNTVDTIDERMTFLANTHATHIVLDPPTYRELRYVLSQWPDRFEVVFDDGGWAVFAVHIPD